MEHQSQILRNLLGQIAEKEVKEDDEDGAIAVEFLTLKRQSTKYRIEKTFATKAAEKQENAKKNRYKDIVPFDHSRVSLSLKTSQNDTDYINANFIRGFMGQKAYIATQGPLPNTVLDFWRMLWEYNVQIVVMACREFEMGRKKCERYWPENELNMFVCEPFVIHCVSEENRGDYLMRSLKVTFNNSSRILHQLHYLNWPDHGVPDSIPPILEMLEEMRLYQEHDDIPICIHCSAGCGRTGALCAIDFTWNLLRKQIIPENFSIFNLVKDMRTQRPSIVQTKEQYELVYKAVKFLFEKNLQIMEMNTLQNEVAETTSPTFSSSDNNHVDFSELVAGLTESILYQESDPRYLEKEMENSNYFIPAVPHQPSDLQPQSLLGSGSKCMPVDLYNETKNMAKSRVGPKPVTSPMQLLQQLKLGHHNLPERETGPLQQSVIIQHRPKIPELSSVQQADVTYAQEPMLLEQNPGFYWPQILDPTPLQPTKYENHVFPKSESPLQQKDFEFYKPEPSSVQLTNPECPGFNPPPQQTSGPEYNQYQILESSLPQQTNFISPKSEIIKPNLHQSNFGYQKFPIPESTPGHQTPPASNHPVEATPRQDFGPIQISQEETVVPVLPEIQPSICLTVEDPYFGPDSLLSNNTLSDLRENQQQWTNNPCFANSNLDLKNKSPEVSTQDKIPELITPPSDEDSPPPLPERTPESYILAEGDKVSNNQELLLDIPTNTVTETSPPSPVPPLPERTPESFEMATDEDLVCMAVQENPQQVVQRVGKSSEWSGNSNSATADIKRTWSRTKSLRARLSLHVSDHVHLQPLFKASTSIQEVPPPHIHPTSGMSPDAVQLQVETSPPLTPPIPARTPGSFFLEQEEQSNSAICQSDIVQQQRLGLSSEWAGNPQNKNSQDVMNRSKSVKVRSTKQVFTPAETLSLTAQPPPAAVATVETALPGPSRHPPVESRQMSVDQPERPSFASRARTKSLKFLKVKQKQKTATPPTGPPPSYGAATRSRFDFGFRFGKPKGPRTQPETWV